MSDPQLLRDIRLHCHNFRKKPWDYKANELAFELQQRHIEYKVNSKKFVKTVQDAIDEMNPEKVKNVPEPEIVTENDVETEAIQEMDDDGPSIEQIVTSEMKNRKRKATATPRSKPVPVKEVVVSSDDEEDKKFDNYKTNNRSNKVVLNLYSKTNGKSASPHSGKLPKKADKDRNATGSAASGSKAQQPPRGLGSVPTLNVVPRESKVKFDDLGGCDRQFLEVCRLAMHLKRPQTYAMLGVEPPKGFLVHGPPGCGKTLFAQKVKVQAVAGQFGVSLLQMAATELVSGVSGETEDKIRQLFEIAKNSAPCVLVLDDIDSIAPRRETATREMERRIVSQLSSSMDELFGPKREKSLQEQLKFTADGDVEIIADEKPTVPHGVLVIGTSSRPESIDNGLRRAGRFDCEISLGIPDEPARKKILETVCKLPLSEDVSMLGVARLTPGYVGADLNALVREAAKCAVNRIFDTVVCHNMTKRRMNSDEIKQELDRVLAWLESDDDPKTIEELGGFHVTMRDFERALENVQPSAKREGFATVPDVSWNDIGALSDVRQELEWNILYPVKRPEDFALLGISARPQGILLCGPPGCGKTLLAKAVANETGMNFISVKGPELLNMYVGESERAVRTVFQRARDSAPCVIFFDEIDALCPKRSNNESTGGARLVNQLLTEMDGVEGRNQVFIIGATNRPDIVDAAILRPGRLDKILFVDFPSADDRADILLKSTKNRTQPKLDEDVDFVEIARWEGLDGFTGADLAAVVHEASIVALKERLSGAAVEAVQKRHFEVAIKNVRASVTDADRKKYEKMRETYAVRRKS